MAMSRLGQFPGGQIPRAGPTTVTCACYYTKKVNCNHCDCPCFLENGKCGPFCICTEFCFDDNLRLTENLPVQNNNETTSTSKNQGAKSTSGREVKPGYKRKLPSTQAAKEPPKYQRQNSASGQLSTPAYQRQLPTSKNPLASKSNCKVPASTSEESWLCAYQRVSTTINETAPSTSSVPSVTPSRLVERRETTAGLKTEITKCTAPGILRKRPFPQPKRTVEPVGLQKRKLDLNEGVEVNWEVQIPEPTEQAKLECSDPNNIQPVLVTSPMENRSILRYLLVENPPSDLITEKATNSSNLPADKFKKRKFTPRILRKNETKKSFSNQHSSTASDSRENGNSEASTQSIIVEPVQGIISEPILETLSEYIQAAISKPLTSCSTYFFVRAVNSETDPSEKSYPDPLFIQLWKVPVTVYKHSNNLFILKLNQPDDAEEISHISMSTKPTTASEDSVCQAIQEEDISQSDDSTKTKDVFMKLAKTSPSDSSENGSDRNFEPEVLTVKNASVSFMNYLKSLSFNGIKLGDSKKYCKAIILLNVDKASSTVANDTKESPVSGNSSNDLFVQEDVQSDVSDNNDDEITREMNNVLAILSSPLPDAPCEVTLLDVPPVQCNEEDQTNDSVLNPNPGNVELNNESCITENTAPDTTSQTIPLPPFSTLKKYTTGFTGNSYASPIHSNTSPVFVPHANDYLLPDNFDSTYSESNADPAFIDMNNGYDIATNSPYILSEINPLASMEWDNTLLDLADLEDFNMLPERSTVSSPTNLPSMSSHCLNNPYSTAATAITAANMMTSNSSTRQNYNNTSNTPDIQLYYSNPATPSLSTEQAFPELVGRLKEVRAPSSPILLNLLKESKTPSSHPPRNYFNQS